MFSLRLKELRESKKISQQELAAKIGVSQSTIGMWESRKREPSFSTIEKIADFFGVSVDYLLGRSSETSIDEQLSGVEFALYGEEKDLTDEEKEKILEFAKFVKSQRK